MKPERRIPKKDKCARMPWAGPNKARLLHPQTSAWPLGPRQRIRCHATKEKTGTGREKKRMAPTKQDSEGHIKAPAHVVEVGPPQRGADNNSRNGSELDSRPSTHAQPPSKTNDHSITRAATRQKSRPQKLPTEAGTRSPKTKRTIAGQNPTITAAKSRLTDKPKCKGCHKTRPGTPTNKTTKKHHHRKPVRQPEKAMLTLRTHPRNKTPLTK